MIDGVVIQTLSPHPDERGFFKEILHNTDAFFEGRFGQLSHSNMVEGVVKAWHVHKTQIDWWYVATGKIKLILYDSREQSPTHKKLEEFYLGEGGQDAMVKIPAGVAHGCKVLKGPANLIYVTSSAYNKDEEGRIAFDDPTIGYDWVQGMPITNKNIT